MKYLLTIVSCLLLTPFMYGQQKTIYGDEVGTLDGIIKAYYEAVTVKKGEKISFQRDSLLHAPNAVVGSVHVVEGGKKTLDLLSLKQFHLNSDAFLESEGFYEVEIGRVVNNFGAIYHVMSAYETRNTATGPILSRGINSIQLYFDGTRFWIMSWIYDSESKDQPIPKLYLKN